MLFELTRWIRNTAVVPPTVIMVLTLLTLMRAYRTTIEPALRYQS